MPRSVEYSNMKITKEIFQHFLLCPYKAYLLSKGETGNKSEYEILFKEIKEKHCADGLKKFSVKPVPVEMIHDTNLKDKNGVVYQSRIGQEEVHSDSCIMEFGRGGSELGMFHCTPVIFTPKAKLSQEDRLEIAYDGFLLETLQSRRPEYGKVIYGDNFKVTRLKIGSQIEKAKNIVAKIKKINLDNPPRIILNRHCQVCEFKDLCRAKAIEKDDLSLLAGIPPKEIEAQNKKGVFTVTQYSYTFRPRKKFRKAYPFNLKALALREQKIHLYGTPVIPISGVQIYLDIEGDPKRDFYYLIGVVVVENGIEKRYSFWADSETEEGDTCLAFVDCIRGYREYKLYHYGSYETKFFQRAQSYARNPDDVQVIEVMIANAVNVLAIVYEHVFFPTYSNGLKDIGAYLGFKWTSEGASGINSLVWRSQFEETRDDNFKQRLLEYNLDDCFALKRVADFISQIIKDIAGGDLSHVDFIQADALKAKSLYKWGTVDFALKDMKRINDCAYFDYQREKVFIRTNKKLGACNKRRIKRYRHRVNKEVFIKAPKKCSFCKVSKTSKARLYKNESFSRTVFDLKFTGSGVRREVISYATSQMRCSRCTKVIATSDEYKATNRYGHGLITFVVYHTIEWHMPYDRIEKMLFDLFGFSRTGMGKKLKNMAVEYYRTTSQQILERILQGKFIHIDETQINIGKVSGYVWVLSNMEDVHFLYTPTREGDFLRGMLVDFKGVIISDFYGAYCYPEWIQQKCLVHLIRDLNDDLRSSPFDEEYKKMTEEFTILLRRVVDTVDKFGLKKRHLAKHKKEAIRFFRDVGRQSLHSELAQKYQKRFLKNENTLFTFLDYDGVPWNNNNAEHAIKHFAVYRNGMTPIGAQIKEEGIKSHLALLSIFQTCRYRGINFLKFLVSKEKDIDRFSQRRSWKSTFTSDNVNEMPLR